MKKVIVSLVLFGLLGSFSRAELLEFNTSTAVWEGDGQTVDLVLHDCVINTDGAEWLSSIFYCELTQGELFQDPNYMATEALKWLSIPGVNTIDSWLAPGVSVFADGNEFAALPHMSGDPANAAASITFIADLQDGKVPAWNGTAAQFAFTPDARGAWAFKVSVKGSNPVIYAGYVWDGQLIPEPGTMLLGLAGVMMLVWRRW